MTSHTVPRPRASSFCVHLAALGALLSACGNDPPPPRFDVSAIGAVEPAGWAAAAALTACATAERCHNELLVGDDFRDEPCLDHFTRLYAVSADVPALVSAGALRWEPPWVGGCLSSWPEYACLRDLESVKPCLAKRGTLPVGSTCALHEVCTTGFCANDVCSECGSDRDCGHNGRCPTSGVCEFVQCSNDLECPSDLICTSYENSCVKPIAPGGTCDISSDDVMPCSRGYECRPTSGDSTGKCRK